MKDLLDVHMHTLASGHAYSTPREMVAAGRRKGLQLIGMSEHAPHMPGTCNEFYFCNFKVIRPEKPGIEIIMGAEGGTPKLTAEQNLIVQLPSMKEQEKENFLSLFENVQGSGSLLGFCVMGGIFSEGIDLKRESLIGTIIVGTGIPMISKERNLLFIIGQSIVCL